MKTSVFIAVLALFGITCEAARLSQHSFAQAMDEDESHFVNYIAKFKRSYKTNGEYNTRLSNFKKNKNIVDTENAKNTDFQLELNKFADLSDKEYKSMLGAIPEKSSENAEFLQTDDNESFLSE